MHASSYPAVCFILIWAVRFWSCICRSVNGESPINPQSSSVPVSRATLSLHFAGYSCVNPSRCLGRILYRALRVVSDGVFVTLGSCCSFISIIRSKDRHLQVLLTRANKRPSPDLECWGFYQDLRVVKCDFYHRCEFLISRVSIWKARLCKLQRGSAKRLFPEW